MLPVVRRSAIKARTQAINQLHALVVTAPEQVKHQLEVLPTQARVKACARFRLERGIYHNHQLATQYQQWLTTPTPQDPI